jgi:hypothetical protein
MKRPSLPATVDEERMIGVFVKYVDRIRDKLVEPPREWLEAQLRDHLRRGLIETQQVVEDAEAGDEIAHAALTRVYHEMLDAGEMPGATLRAYKARADLRPAPRRAAGAYAWHDNWRRDWGFMALICLACEAFNFNPTRNRESRRARRPCGASVVAAALQRRSIDVSEARLTNLWSQQGKIAARYFALWRSSFTLIPGN